jgi:hypothetical protein
MMKKVNDFIGKFFLPLILSIIVGFIAYKLSIVLTNK